MTPPGRLEAMTLRLTATLEAVQTVKPAMEAFYNSLSDEQKSASTKLGRSIPRTAPVSVIHPRRMARAAASRKPDLPICRSRGSRRSEATDAQEGGLKHLENATAKAVSLMQAACPGDTPITPPGRLEAMEKASAGDDRCSQYGESLPLNDFYGSLSSEQKARFNRIGGELAHSGN